MSKMHGVVRLVDSRYRSGGDMDFRQWRAMLSCGHMVICHEDVDPFESDRVLCVMCQSGDGSSPAALEVEPVTV